MLEDLIRVKNLDAKLEEVLVADDEEARRLHFAGSPQIMINGRDIDPAAERVTNFHASGCRLYVYHDKVYDYPPREMIRETLERISNS